MYPGNRAVASFQPVSCNPGRVNMVYLYAAAGISIVFLPFVLYVKTLYSQVFFIMPGLSRAECKGMLKTLQKAHERTQMAVFPPDGKLPALADGRLLNLRHRTAVCVPYQKQTYAYFYLELVSLKSAEAAGAKA